MNHHYRLFTNQLNEFDTEKEAALLFTVSSKHELGQLSSSGLNKLQTKWQQNFTI